MMRFRTFTVCGDSDCAEVNAFLAAHRVLRVERSFEGGSWHLLVEYDERGDGPSWRLGRGQKVDYREVLNADDFATFAKLREVRKRLAEADGVAVFAVATNEQLAQFAREKAKTLAALQAIPGFGAARAEKYGEAFLAALAEGEKGGGAKGDDAKGGGE